MLPSIMTLDRNKSKASKTIILIFSAVIIGLVGLATASTSSSALNLGPSVALGDQTKAPNTDLVEVRAVVRRGGVAVGPRGNAAAYRSRTVVRGPAVVRPGVRWARPGWYRWPAGGAIAAGAAIGFVAAASAAAYAGAAPAPGMCWYYTDPSRTQGFWDSCPQ